MGDSEGPACSDPQATADREAQGYVAALKLLQNADFVDSNNIFVFAHSLGPLIGAIVLPQLKIRGFIAAETAGRSWLEYEVENIRRPSVLIGDAYDKVEESARAHADCAFHFFFQHEPAEVVSKRGPCAAMIQNYGAVPGPYMQQIGDLRLPDQWKQVDLPVLVVYGTCDPVTSAGESRYLVDLINNFHPDRATYTEVPNMGHDFSLYDSPAAYLNSRAQTTHPYATDLLPILITWLQQHSA